MLDLFISSAHAEGAAAAGPNGFSSFMPMMIIFVIFYFFLIRPQKKKLEDEQKLISALGKGDEIFTKSGLLGTITGMTEKIVTLDIGEGIKMKVLKSQVGGLAKKLFEEKKN